jgi:phosphate transport system permease protein
MSSTNKKEAAASSNAPRERPIDIVKRGMLKRRRAEQRFRAYGLGAIILSLCFLGFLLFSICASGYTAFLQTYVKLQITFDKEELSKDVDTADYGGMVKASLRYLFPDVKSRKDKKQLYSLVSPGAAFDLRNMVHNDPGIIGKTLDVWVPANDDVDMAMKGVYRFDVLETERRISDKQVAWINILKNRNCLEKRFNRTFFSAGDSREPELAGILGAAWDPFTPW